MYEKAFNIAKNQKNDGFQRGLPSMVYKFFDKKISGSGIKNYVKQRVSWRINKPFVKKFNKREVHSSSIDNIWVDDFADMQLISKFNKWIRFLIYVIDIYSKYAWVVLLKDEKGITITNTFQKILDESNRKPKTLWADKGCEFYNR